MCCEKKSGRIIKLVEESTCAQVRNARQGKLTSCRLDRKNISPGKGKRLGKKETFTTEAVFPTATTPPGRIITI